MSGAAPHLAAQPPHDVHSVNLGFVAIGKPGAGPGPRAGALDPVDQVLLAVVGPGGQEGLEHLAGHVGRREPQAQGQDVGVVPAAGAAGRLGVGAQRGPHPGDLVGGHGHAGARPAAHHPDVGVAAGDRLTHLPPGVGPVDTVPATIDVVAHVLELGHDGVGERRGLVGAESDSHLRHGSERARAVGPGELGVVVGRRP